MQSSKLIIIFLIGLLIIPHIYGSVSNQKEIQIFTSIPSHHINCIGFDDNVGIIFEKYYCFFNYSIITLEQVHKGCRLVVMDDKSGSIFYNSSFDDIFTKQKTEIEDHYEYTTNQIIPITFEYEERRTLVFSLNECEYESLNGIIETKQYNILSLNSYYLKKQLDSANRGNIILAVVSTFLTILSIFLVFRPVKVGDIQDFALDKIKKTISPKKRERKKS